MSEAIPMTPEETALALEVAAIANGDGERVRDSHFSDDLAKILLNDILDHGDPHLKSTVKRVLSTFHMSLMDRKAAQTFSTALDKEREKGKTAGGSGE